MSTCHIWVCLRSTCLFLLNSCIFEVPVVHLTSVMHWCFFGIWMLLYITSTVEIMLTSTECDFCCYRPFANDGVELGSLLVPMVLTCQLHFLEKGSNQKAAGNLIIILRMVDRLFCGSRFLISPCNYLFLDLIPPEFGESKYNWLSSL